MPVRLCGGRVLKRALWGLCLASTFVSAQVPQPKPPAKKVGKKRANELTLAGLHPGRDSLARATELYKQFGDGHGSQGDRTVWADGCRGLTLTIDGTKEKRIEVIRVGFYFGPNPDCSKQSPGPWKTGKGLHPGDLSASVTQLYGEAEARSPSTRDGQPLELLHYAFDWAGPDVPQVMEVLCTREKEGQPGRVVEITLAASHL